MNLIKQVDSPFHGRPVKFGRRRAPARGPRLSLRNYLNLAALPAEPFVDWRTACPTPLESALTAGLADILGNDSLGDCTCAGVGHFLDVLNCCAGTGVQITADQVIKLYELACGYNPSDPSTDQGGDEYSVLDYVAQHGIDGAGLHQIVGSAVVDGSNFAEVCAAIYLFGTLYFGVELPDAWINPFPASPGFTWDVAGAPDPANGHCFIGVGSTADGIQIDTWGMIGLLTKEAIAQYTAQSAGGELHVVITKEWIDSARALAPNGIAWDELLADFQAIGGPPLPVPVPAPPINPPSPPALTLDQAQAILAQGWPAS